MSTALPDTEPQIAAGKVLWHFTMSLDGFIAGPNHTMDWMEGITNARPISEELHEHYRRHSWWSRRLRGLPRR